ncbi:DUF1616 domain-containing protein [Halorussus marinus]|uniref:DUF1616 domain-containing protein n=1 Tax=Halorussus marinus TaxID=2505976 RepID=UPI00106E5EC6|nr:DUF1616 domain-containing protein [Halorussus marinus]
MVLDRVAAWVASAFEINGRHSAAVNALVLVVAIVGIAGVGYTAAVSEGTHEYTEFYLLAENESGELVAQGYPASIQSERPNEFHVGVENHRSEPTTYSVVVKLQRMYTANETPEVLEEETVTVDRIPLAADAGTVERLNVSPEMRGSDMRLRFLLYPDDPPENASIETASHETHLWLNVTAPAESDATASAGLPSR